MKNQGPVLVLNRFYQAVSICTVQRAMRLLCHGRANVIQEENGYYNSLSFQDWCLFSETNPSNEHIATIRLKIRIPKVILLLFNDRRPHSKIKLTRQNIYLRDKHTCQYCGQRKPKSELNLDHVIPRDHGGKSTWENLVCSCIQCNTQKRNRTPAEAGMKLQIQPRKPLSIPYIHIQFHCSQKKEAAWKNFVDIESWQVTLGN